MGFFDRFRRNQERTRVVAEARPSNVEVGAAREEGDEMNLQTFSNSNITFSGDLEGFCYDRLLRNKQASIQEFFKLSDYYVDADPIIHGIVHHALVPFSSCSDWYLTNAKDKTCKMYEEQYKKMRLREKIEGIMLEYWKYGNVYIYLYDDQLITLPVNHCRIGNVALNGMPLVDFDCCSILAEWRNKGYVVKENWIKDNSLEIYFKGYPEEIREGLNKGNQFVQLDPSRCFVMQGPKESWQRYCVPFIASCLTALAKKELISKYEKSIINLGTRSFVHVPYGDKTKGADILPDREQLIAVRRLFQQGMSGFPLVVTNQLAEAKVIQPEVEKVFEWPKYTDVNNDILSAGGISGIIVSGLSQDGSTFASAQVSMQTAEARINAARDEFCEIMCRINKKLAEVMPATYNLKEIPQFNFMPLDMNGKKALRESCQNLWEKGVVSTKTMMEMNGYSLDVEKAQRTKEASDGTDEKMVPHSTTPVATVAAPSSSEEEDESQGRGRPKLDDDERKSDPQQSDSGSRPKPSRPEGSGDNAV